MINGFASQEWPLFFFFWLLLLFVSGFGLLLLFVVVCCCCLLLFVVVVCLFVVVRKQKNQKTQNQKRTRVQPRECLWFSALNFLVAKNLAKLTLLNFVEHWSLSTLHSFLFPFCQPTKKIEKPTNQIMKQMTKNYYSFFNYLFCFSTTTLSLSLFLSFSHFSLLSLSYKTEATRATQ